MSGVTDMKLAGPNFSKDVILQIFTFLDMDKDNKLKYADFCSLVSQGRQGKEPVTVDDPFLSVLRNIKSKKAPRPNTSAPRIDNKPRKPTNGFEFVKTLEDISHGEGISNELQRYMQRTKNFQTGHSVYSPVGVKMDVNEASAKIAPSDSISNSAPT
jgi:hypothetical protein